MPRRPVWISSPGMSGFQSGRTSPGRVPGEITGPPLTDPLRGSGRGSSDFAGMLGVLIRGEPWYGRGVRWESSQLEEVPWRDQAPQRAGPTLPHLIEGLDLLRAYVEEPPQTLRLAVQGRGQHHPRAGHDHPGGDRDRLSP